MSNQKSLFFLFLFITIPTLLICDVREPDLEPRKISKMRTSFFNSHSENFYLLEGIIREGYYIAGSTVLPFKDKEGKINKFTDLIVYKKDGKGTYSFYAQLYSYENSNFSEPIQLFDIISEDPEYEFSNLFIGSIIGTNHNYIDYIVSLQKKSNNPSQPQDIYKHYLIEQSFLGFHTNVIKVYNDMGVYSNILIGDFDGDRNLEILFNDEEGRKYINFTTIKEYTKLPFTTLLSKDAKKCPKQNLYQGHIQLHKTLSYLDINGDCVSDIVLSHFDFDLGGVVFEVYLGIKYGIDYDNKDYTKGYINYCMIDEIYIKGTYNTIGGANFVDLDHSALLSLLVPVLGTNSFWILKNTLNLHYKWEENYCEKHLSKDSNITKIYTEPYLYTLNNIPKGYTIYSLYNAVFRFGDYEGSMYHGFLCTFIYNSTDNDIYRVYLIRMNNKEDRHNSNSDNIDNIDNLNGTINTKNDIYKNFKNTNHTFLNIENNIFDLDFVFHDAIFGCFFDIDEDGVLDVLIQHTNGTTSFYYNKIQTDKYFIKSKLIDVTLIKDKISDDKDNNDYNDFLYKYVFVEPGATFYFFVTNPEGERELTSSFQYIHTNGGYMETPFAITGIGRSNNYIENFISVSNSFDMKRLSPGKYGWGEGDESKTSPVIPNTQLLISKIFDNSTIKWEIELIVQPTDKLLLLVVIVAAVLLVVLFFIIYLHMKEVKEEEEEAKTFTTWFG